MANKTAPNKKDVALDEVELSLERTSSAIKHGEVEQLRKEFSVWSLGALLVCLMGTWEALAANIASALTNGGPPCLFYNYIITFLGTLTLAASMAEIASIYPSAGGQYIWVAMLSSDDIRPAASWLTGWISIGGQLTLTASGALFSGLLLQALLILNNPSYSPQRWHGVMLYFMVLAYSLLINCFGSRLLARTNVALGVIHVLGFIIVVTVLGSMAEDKNTPQYVFAGFSNSSGYTSDGISWLVGLISTVYPFLGYDAASHLAEEIPRPSKYVPIAMLGSIVVNGIMGLILCIVLLFCLGDLDSLLKSATGYPFIQLYFDVTKNHVAATIMTLAHALTALGANAAGLTSTSRTAFAFARDGAFPFSQYYSRLDPKSHLPVRLCVLLTILQALLGLIYIGNTTAVNAIVSMSITGMYLSYMLPIGFMLWSGRRRSRVQRTGWFTLGRWGSTVNVIALIWATVATLFSMFPSYQPVTAQNMNYSSLVLGAWTFGGAIYYLIYQRKVYEGPVPM